jgi:hypothetical protein
MRHGGWANGVEAAHLRLPPKSGSAHVLPVLRSEEWHGWDERVTLDHAIGSGSLDRRAEAFPLTCANCGFVRLQAAHVLDDPRDETRNPRG